MYLSSCNRWVSFDVALSDNVLPPAVGLSCPCSLIGFLVAVVPKALLQAVGPLAADRKRSASHHTADLLPAQPPLQVRPATAPAPPGLSLQAVPHILILRHLVQLLTVVRVVSIVGPRTPGDNQSVLQPLPPGGGHKPPCNLVLYPSPDGLGPVGDGLEREVSPVSAIASALP